jgi:thiamine pyrophosphokinase
MSFKTLRFILPDVLVCLNGILPERSFFEKLLPIPIAAADGAAKKLRERGITPNMIIGDLDSLADELDLWRVQKGIVIHEVSDQNSTDFEKTLTFVREQGKTNILVCGLHGGDLDHTLNNWSITMRHSAYQHLAVFDNGKIAVPIRTSVQFTAGIDEMISLIPQPSVHLSTTGLEWNLSREVLEMGKREGARNTATATMVQLDIHEGSLLLFMQAQLPYMPVVQ